VAKFDLTMALVPCIEQSGRLGSVAGVLNYNTDLFDGETAGRVARQSLELVRSFANSALATVVHQLSMISEAEMALVRETLPCSGGDAPVPCAADPLHAGFEASAQRAPGATALVTLVETLTYAELDGRANTLARVLQPE
jgi:non-ribosomal peptide synthetase component F